MRPRGAQGTRVVKTPLSFEEALAMLDVDVDYAPDRGTTYAIVGIEDVRAAHRAEVDRAVRDARVARPCAVDIYGGGCRAPADRSCVACGAQTCADHARVWYGEHGCALCMDGPPLARRVPDDGIAGGQGRTADEVRTSADVVLAVAFGLVGLAVAVWAVLAAWGAW